MMGYDIHITRKPNWFDEEPKIALEEWESYAESDPILSAEGWVDWKVNGNVVRAKIFVVSEEGNPEGAAALSWDAGGDVSAKNPTPAGIAYMASIAARLNARVQGDDGEFYDPLGNPIRD
jgi:hypothetical protein